jgi:hypothetical protein
MEILNMCKDTRVTENVKCGKQGFQRIAQASSSFVLVLVLVVG